MKEAVLVDTNLALLLIVGSASRDYIPMHRKLQDYDPDDFDVIRYFIAQFSYVVTLPHLLSEMSGIARQIRNPALARIQIALKTFIAGSMELHISSMIGCERREYTNLGLVDALMIQLCDFGFGGIYPTLLTADTKLADAVPSLGCDVIDYQREFKSK